MRYTITIIILLHFHFGIAQVSFSDSGSLLNDPNFSSFQPAGISDLNGDGLDDILRINRTNPPSNLISVEFQQPGGSAFTNLSFPSPSGQRPWGLAIADVDANGYNDFLLGGSYDGIRLYKSSGGGSSFTPVLLSGSIFLQGVNFADINSDGLIDIFACHDDSTPLQYRGMGSGNFLLDGSMVNPAPYAGNYGSVWTDYNNDGLTDLYIAKCRGGVSSPTDPRRINGLYKNNGDGTFTELASAAGIADGEQSWAADFGDIDNDGDLDLFILNHTGNNKLMEQTGAPALLVGGHGVITLDENKSAGLSSGTYSDISLSSGINPNGNSDWQSIFADFDNDGFLDLLISGSQYALYLNNGDQTFTQASNPFPSGVIRNFAIGDLNHDGFLDIFATYGSWANSSSQADKILMNSGNSNNWIAFNLTGSTSNINGIGARLELYGPWGVQIRDVHSGQSYGIMNTLTQHFGLGTNSQIDSLIVKWPSGIKQKLTGLVPNTFIPVLEMEVFLSVELLRFDASPGQNHTVELVWETASERENAWFVIERSKDGETYEEIGSLPGSGTSSIPLQYRTADPFPFYGENYYRLKMIDVNGEYTFSEVKVVAFESKEELNFRVSPNLLSSEKSVSIFIENPSGNPIKISVWSSSGALLSSFTEGNGNEHFQIKMPLGGLSKGLYFIVVDDGMSFGIRRLVVM